MSTTTADRERLEDLAKQRREAMARVEALTDQLTEASREQFARGATVNSLVRITKVAPQTMARWLA
jgi:hypothetical protein